MSQRGSPFSAALLSVRIVHIDHYSHSLSSLSSSLPFQAARLTSSIPQLDTPPPRLPVIRIFGSTPAGQTVCVHLHGLFPYLYLPVPQSIAPAGVFPFAHQLRQALESTLSTAYADDSANATAFIADVEPVLRRDCYGYYAKRRLFLKVFVYAPRTVARVASIVQEGGMREILGDEMRCYAAHVPFVMQVMVDYGLVGMGFVHFRKVRFRRPMPAGEDAAMFVAKGMMERQFVDGLEKCRSDLFWPFHVARKATSDIEVDVFSDDIINDGDMVEDQKFVVRTLGVLWEEEKLRTGVYPKRDKRAIRKVKAGGHLTDEDSKSRVEELMLVKWEDENTKAGAESVGLEAKIDTSQRKDKIARSEKKQMDPLESGLMNPEEKADNDRDIPVPISQMDPERALEEVRGSQQALERDNQSQMVLGSLEDILEVLDEPASYPNQEEEIDIQEFEDEEDGIADFEDEFVDQEKEMNGVENDDPNPVEPNWRDIAACTQHKSATLEEGTDNLVDGNTLPQGNAKKKKTDENPDSGFGSSQEIDEDVPPEQIPNLKTLKDLRFSTQRRYVLETPPSVEDSDDIGEALSDPDHPKGLSISHSHKIASIDIPPIPSGDTLSQSLEMFPQPSYVNDYIHPAERPPSVFSLDAKQVDRNPFAIDYITPFYGDKRDEAHSGRAFGGLIIPVRESGAAGFPPFPPLFEEVKTNVEILPRVVRPAGRPPTIQDLTQDDTGTGNSVQNPSHQGKMAIDSAGRQVFQNYTGTSRGSQLFSYDPAIDFMVYTANKGNTSGSDEDSLDSEGSDNETPNEGTDPGNTLTAEVLVQNRPLSPKYDEGFQHYVLPGQHASETPRKTSRSEQFKLNDSESPRLRRNSVASLSESIHRYQNLTVMSIEVLASCYGAKLPDPNQNSVLAVCTVTQRDHRDNPHRKCLSVTFAVDTGVPPKCLNMPVVCMNTELALLDALAHHIREQDPDVIVGYETQNASIGFILERAQVIAHPFQQASSRWITKGVGGGVNKADGQAGNAAAIAYYQRKGADIKISGRHVISLWRIVRKEVKLPEYSRETVSAELFETTFPRHTAADLETWFKSKKKSERAFQHLARMTTVNIAILDKLNTVSRTGELARVFGIDFMDVLTRGSQFRVESMLGRIARTQDFLLLSAARNEVFKQPAVEALPLVMEPHSALYVDPVIVLDFQSLYPSVIIAHNLCYTTMLGNIHRVSAWSEPRRIGVLDGYSPGGRGTDAEIPMDKVFVTSSGEMFVDSSLRKGILPQLLREILETRVMVKKAMKGIVEDDETAGLLNARQFGLKMIANVTYGYTAASFSGRMPCAGLADAIVQCGRDSLEEIVRYVEEELRPENGATVVYGDTDSLFVKVPGATRAEAFDLGETIVKKAAELFPEPITLKLEKVYQPSVMQTKKRYVGYSYESKNQAVPIFDAKGIETVRRDSCLLVQKTLEKSIRILFETRNISTVKRYVQRLCQKLHLDRIPFSDYIFRKEVRLGSYKEGHLPPAAIVATKCMEHDPRTVPRYGERVPFVVLYDRPGAPLKDCVVSPLDYLHAASLGLARLNTTYYITKQILPTLDRIFSLVGVSVMSWYAEIPRPLYDPILPANVKKRTRRNQSSLRMFYTAERCNLCHGKSIQRQICDDCLNGIHGLQAAHFLLSMRARQREKQATNLRQICTECSGDLDSNCINITCPVYDELAVAKRKHAALVMLLDDELIWK